MFILQLNDMRASNIENIQPVLWAETREEIERLLENEKTEPYTDGQWGKSFKQGGLLEWKNAPSEDGTVFGFAYAIVEWNLEESLEEIRDSYSRFKTEHPMA